MQPVIAKDFQKVVMGFECLLLSKLHFDAIFNISIVRKSGVPRFEPGAAGSVALVLPQY